MDHASFSKMLFNAYHERSDIRRNVRLPSDRDIRFGGDTQCMTLYLSAAAVQANMQEDRAAFDAWSVIFIEWCNVRQVVVDWDEPADTANGHYQRFLYRLRHFGVLLGSEVVRIANPDRLTKSRIGNGSVAFLNVAGTTDTASIASLGGSEADLEKRLAGANPTERARLMAALGLVKLDRQMPVGVFEGQPSRAGAIFTGGKSAIDLVGLDRAGALWLLELKTLLNIRIGALAELLFYSMVLRDACVGRFLFPSRPAGPRSTVTPADICAAPRIHARLLSQASHPLLIGSLFDRLTAVAAAQAWAIDYGFLDLSRYLDTTEAAEV
jgi:hypothetical protein